MKQLIFFFMCISAFVQAQQNSFEKSSIHAMPGVINKSPGMGLLTEYHFQPGFTMENLNGQSQKVAYKSIWNFKLKIPLVLKPTLTVLGGINYQEENYYFNNNSFDNTDLLFTRLNTTTLKTTRFSLYASKSLNDKFYLGIKADATYSGDYRDFSENFSRFATYRATAVLGYKPNKKTEYGLGLLYSNNFRRTIILPVVYMNRTFNNQWGLELTLPVKLKARYNFSPKSLLLFGSDFESRNYSINASGEGEYLYHFRRSALSFNVAYQHNIKGWLWFQTKAGYNLNFRNRIDDVQTVSTSRLNQNSAPFFSIGFFLSPTRKRK